MPVGNAPFVKSHRAQLLHLFSLVALPVAAFLAYNLPVGHCSHETSCAPWWYVLYYGSYALALAWLVLIALTLVKLVNQPNRR